LVQLMQVTAMVCCNGTYVKRVQGRERHAADLQTFVSFGIEAGALLGNVAVGAVVERLGPRSAWGIAALPAALVLGVSASGFFEESRVTEEELTTTRRGFWQHREVGALAMVLFASTLLTNSLTIGYGSLGANVVAYLVGFVFVLFCFAAVLSPRIAQVSVYSMLYQSAMLNVDGAMFYFYTDEMSAYAEGPHLSSYFYNGIRGPLFCAFALVGIYTYNRYMKEWTYRRVIVFGNLSYALVQVSTLIIVSRMNLRLGIPDSVFVLVHAALRSMTQQWTKMPFRVLFMFLCPPGMEATMYALLKGSSDLGNSVSDSLGGALLAALGCRPSGIDGESESFRHLPLALVVSGLTGLLVVTLFLPLVPDAEPNRLLVGDDACDATSGSLWSTWLGEAASKHGGSSDPRLSGCASGMGAMGAAAAVLERGQLHGYDSMGARQTGGKEMD